MYSRVQNVHSTVLRYNGRSHGVRVAMSSSEWCLMAWRRELVRALLETKLGGLDAHLLVIKP